ncbi:hypothetical protein [Marinobacter nauticus]|uniref:Uncharacterized protein n=1 Tax=Marinobacter nauticus (strain ATCC 700491 / DSM 11845 / VT8) TaxID=351348 RepID=A1TZ26_MARN8|nr:hypothetical protein [Marinobacter nauticus]ABM17995.1 conserved hypothetical protein [Marinobacter nauticus VT8]
MFWTFVATVFCGLGAAGIALGIRAATAKKAPKWLIPVFAGAGMLGYLIYGEYTWYDHKRAMLPEEAVVVATEQEKIFFRPWTFVFPYVTSFSAVDRESISRDTGDQDIVRFTLYRFEQTVTDAVSHRVHLINCGSRELVPLGSDGAPRVDNMKLLESNDPLYTTVCRS